MVGNITMVIAVIACSNGDSMNKLEIGSDVQAPSAGRFSDVIMSEAGVNILFFWEIIP